MELLEAVTGNRVQFDFSIVGGVARDLKPDLAKKILQKLNTFKPKLDDLMDIFRNNWSLSLKNKGIGSVTRDNAMKLGAVRPLARAAGLAIDVRNETEDLLPWKQVGFELITENAGDVHARNLVRLRELYVSIKIIENILNGLPEGPILQELKTLPEGDATVRIEAPRGELFYFARGNKTQILERLKIKAPTFSNIPAFVEIFKGNEYASAPAIIASYDPCLSCTAR